MQTQEVDDFDINFKQDYSKKLGRGDFDAGAHCKEFFNLYWRKEALAGLVVPPGLVVVPPGPVVVPPGLVVPSRAS